jgi:thiamine biosynthesis lipoprotein
MSTATVSTSACELVTRSVRLERVMGCRAGLTVTAAARDVDGLVAAAEDRLRHLERCWSRFLPDSDISRLNRARGRPVVVDPWTITLITAMAAGARATTGAFDPTLLVALVGLGYGPSWSPSNGGDAAVTHHDRLRWIDVTRVDRDRATVMLAGGVQLDPGAIGKGLAADLVADELLERGAVAATVDVGGDVRVTSPSVIGVNGPDRRPLDRIALASGGVATSGTSRRWIAAEGAWAHHVLDLVSRRPLPRTAVDDAVQVTVAAASAAHAEVHATAVLVDPSERRINALDHLGVGVLVVDRRGIARENEAWRGLRRSVRTVGGAA